MDRSEYNDLEPRQEPHELKRRRRGRVPLASVSAGVHELLRCASSGYLGGGCRCHAHVPADVAREAWQRETLLTHRAEGFFHFLWRGGQWLGYGTADGSVRGVYCATHCSERSARIVGERVGAVPQPASAAHAG